METDQIEASPTAYRSLLRLLALWILCISTGVMAGCSADPQHTEGNESDTKSEPTKKNGPQFAECAGISPTEIARELGESRAQVQFRNSVTCQWIIGNYYEASFTWYRGSPIGREESWEGRTRDEVQHITVKGYPAFQIYQGSLGRGLCEIGVDFGNDFIEWSMRLNQVPKGQDPCTSTLRLTELSIERAQK